MKKRLNMYFDTLSFSSEWHETDSGKTQKGSLKKHILASIFI
jgi:hypothetical protein